MHKIKKMTVFGENRNGVENKVRLRSILVVNAPYVGAQITGHNPSYCGSIIPLVSHGRRPFSWIYYLYKIVLFVIS